MERKADVRGKGRGRGAAGPLVPTRLQDGLGSLGNLETF